MERVLRDSQTLRTAGAYFALLRKRFRGVVVPDGFKEQIYLRRKKNTGYETRIGSGVDMETRNSRTPVAIIGNP